MNFTDWISFLLGSKDAIELFARNVHTLWIGAALTLSAAFARTYARRYIVCQSWWLLTPFAASIVMAGLVFGIMSIALSNPYKTFPPESNPYVALLGLFWLTSPLAWIYALPVERFVDLKRAVPIRFGMLAFVAIWRVALMGQVVCVLLDCSILSGCWLVLFCGLAVATSVGFWGHIHEGDDDPPGAPIVLANVAMHMGGIDSESVLTFRYDNDPNFMRDNDPNEVLHCLRTKSGCVLLPLLVGCAFVLEWTLDAEPNLRAWSGFDQFEAPSVGLIGFAVGSIAVWLPILLVSQKAQRIRYIVDRLVGQRQFSDAIAVLSRASAKDLPHGWSPPGENWPWRKNDPCLLDVVAAIDWNQTDEWVCEHYLERLQTYIAEPLYYYLSNECLTKLADVLVRIPNGPELSQAACQGIDEFEARLRTMESRQVSEESHESHTYDEEDVEDANLREALRAEQAERQRSIGRVFPHLRAEPDWPEDSVERDDAVRRLRELAANN